MKTLKVGVASYEEMKARTLEVARGFRRMSPDEPKVWFVSSDSVTTVLAAGNRRLLQVAADAAVEVERLSHPGPGVT